VVTLIQESGSGGRGRRCDARCYQAKRPKCRCVCGGRNHGVGLAQAQANMREDWERAVPALRQINLLIEGRGGNESNREAHKGSGQQSSHRAP